MTGDGPALPHPDPPLRLLVRTAGLCALTYATSEQARPGLAGARLAVLLLLVAATAGWLAWVGSGYLGARRWALAGLVVVGAAGGALVPFTAVALAYPAAAGVAAGSSVDGIAALGLTAIGPAAAAVALGATGQPIALFGGAVAGGLAGLVVGGSRRQYQSRTEQAAQLAVARELAEVEHARAAVLAERNRLAREVHDVLAHSLGGLAVQMEALDALVANGADRDRVLAEVRRSRALVTAGLEETRRAVGVLREEPGPLADQLGALAARSGAAFAVRGEARPVPPDAALALYRAAQEALTNAGKHARGAPVSVTLDFTGRRAELTVTNAEPALPGGPLAASGAGLGLVGMRERVELVGGELAAGPEGAGWQVRVRVPA